MTRVPASPLRGLADATDRATVGGKTAALARLHAAGLPVPPSAVLPILTPATDLEATARQLCEWAAEQSEPALVIRSSNTTEDGPGSSFAGIYRSRFTPAEPGPVLAALGEVRSSALTATARARPRRG